MEEAPGQDGSGREQDADGLIAMEEAALGFAAGLALLLDVVAEEFVVHGAIDGAFGLAEV